MASGTSSDLPRIICAFTYFNEIDLLRYRYQIYRGLVDHFVIVEGAQTFQGDPKPFYLDEQLAEHGMLEKPPIPTLKLRYTAPQKLVDEFREYRSDPEKQFSVEIGQRNALKAGLDYLKLKPTDLVILGDADEFANVAMISHCLNQGFRYPGLTTLECDFYYYHLKCRSANRIWRHLKMFTYDQLEHSTPQQLRMQFGGTRSLLGHRGWHLSYFGTREQIQRKFRSFAEVLVVKPEHHDPEHIDRCIRECTDLLGRPTEHFGRVELQTNPNLPPDYQWLLEHFYHPE